MDFIQKNLRAIIIALLAIGVVVIVANAGSNDDDAQNNQDTAVVEGEEATEETTEEATEATNEEGATEEENTSGDENATDDSEANDDEEQAEAPQGVTAGESDYTVSASSGDNQTVLVRQIIDQYASDNEGTELTAEEQLYVETNLVGALPRNDVILVGDTVRLDKETVKTTVEAAKGLTEEQRSAWATYL